LPERAPWAALPIHLTQITIALGYFFAGMTKLAVSGPGWANGYTLMGVMVEYRSPWSEHFYGDQRLLVVMSLGLLAGQAGFPLVFLGTFWRWVFLPIAVTFHVMAMKTMGTGAFLTLWLALSCFLAWRRALVALGFTAVAWETVAIYSSSKPAWLPWLLLPVAYTLLLAACPRWLAPVTVAVGPDARRAGAWLAALDWARRLGLVRDSGAGLRVRREGGEELAGGRALAAVLARLPLAPLALPALLSAASAQSPGSSQPARTPDER
jgi:hypothetical protein